MAKFKTLELLNAYAKRNKLHDTDTISSIIRRKGFYECYVYGWRMQKQRSVIFKAAKHFGLFKIRRYGSVYRVTFKEQD